MSAYHQQKFTAIISVFFFDEMLNTSRVTSFNTIWKSCFHLLPHSEGSKSTIIADEICRTNYDGVNKGLLEERSVIAQSSVTFQHRITNKRKMGMLRLSFRKYSVNVI